MQTKVCCRCHIEKPISEFYRRAGVPDGHHYHCKQCGAEESKKRREDHPEKMRAWKVAYRKNNQEKVKAARVLSYRKNKATENAVARAYKAAHRAELHAKAFEKYWSAPDKARATQLAYLHTHPEKARAWRMNRITRERQAMPAWADKKAIEAIYRRAVLLTKSTGVPHEVDHIIPLKGRNVCGLHCEANLRVITKQENRRKSNLFDQSLLAAVAA